ncbi:MAG: Glycine-tRNA ligase [Parcubacteria group bacterium GW2011_GWE2_38_18]|nr:MAG: Glycine-tRNA ligase [Parcubacteria group bacterium GW2011_GWE2_38_18]
MSEKKKVTMEQIVSLCKRRGFVFPGSEIYGGMANSWDYGPYGTELKNNIAKSWWKTFVQERDDVVGLDSAIITNPKVWVASGHVANFNDPLVDCKGCKTRHRGDKLLEEKIGVDETAAIPFEEVGKKLNELQIVCPNCGKTDWTDARKFNLLFETQVGVLADPKNIAYLRGETAQGIFINFKNVVNTMRKKLPFGIAQVGKAFRNEITPGNFIFRTREFEQMEIEYFIKPPQKDEDWREPYDKWMNEIKAFFNDKLGLAEENMRWRRHDSNELSFYSKDTYDVEYNFPNLGWGELQGFAYRTDYDLNQHIKHSGADLNFVDDEGSKFVPHCIEPSFGLTRTLLAVLAEAYNEEEVGENDTRIVMKFKPALAPIKVAVFPLLKNKPALVEKAQEIYKNLKPLFMCEFDDNGNVGKRYRRQDEIGTPFCVTVDFDTIEKDNSVTVRDRDSMEQVRVSIDELEGYLAQKLQ